MLVQQPFYTMPNFFQIDWTHDAVVQTRAFDVGKLHHVPQIITEIQSPNTL